MSHQRKRGARRVAVIGQAVLVGGMAGACGSAGAPAVGSGPDAGSSIVFVGGNGYPRGMVQVTNVRTEPDGSHTVTTTLITKEQDAKDQERKRAYLATPPEARTPYLLTDETSCPDWSVWLYGIDTTYCPAKICFYNTADTQDYAALSSYPAPIYIDHACQNYITWEDNVGQYYPGNEQGCLSSTASNVYATGATDYINFNKLQALTAVPWEDYDWANYLWNSGIDSSGNYDGHCINCNTSGGYTGNCGDVCKDLNSDNNNCGSCGNVCSGGMTCQTGACACPAGETDCSGVCVNLLNNQQNCGSCGNNVSPHGCEEIDGHGGACNSYGQYCGTDGLPCCNGAPPNECSSGICCWNYCCLTTDQDCINGDDN
jgi:hypothetical protein